MINKMTGRFMPCVLMLMLLAAGALGQTPPAPQPAPQPPPANDIFLVEMSSVKSELKVGEPKRITLWEGYNNQPSFLPKAPALLYTSIRADRQADIYRYDLRDGSTTRVTETTATAEYSPTPAPDGKSFSVIRVEEDGTQRLWMFPLAGGAANPSLILEKIKPVGYHVWIDSHRLMLFVLGTPVTMQLADLRTQKAEIIADNIGRSLHRIPRERKISFVRKFSEKEWMIQAFDTETHAITSLIRTLPGSEDYTWTPQGTLLMASGSKLFKWNPERDAGWQEVADFARAGLKTITRLSVSPRGDHLALVAQRASAP